ncbi:MAG: hypothetical protein Kow0029_09190 [Candidatus Rifleibacteriota bacterium]
MMEMKITEKILFSVRNYGNKSGIAMFSAIFVMVIIGLLALQFHFMTRQAQSTAYRFQASEVARQLAESAVDEAFMYVFKESENSSGTFFSKLVNRTGAIDCSTTSLDNISAKGEDIPVDLTRAQAATILNGNKFNIEAKARIIDFRDHDTARYTGAGDGKYYDKEGVGTLEIWVSVQPKDEFKKQIQSGCVISRHHDYKVVCIVSKRDNTKQRSSYVQNFVLDYALFVRNGQEEFDTLFGLSINPEKQKFVIDQTGLTAANCGKVFLGNRPGRFMYLNIDTPRKDFIPAPVEKKKLITVTDDGQLNALFPEFVKMLREEARKKVEAEGAKLDAFSFTNWKAFFEYARYPITDEALQSKDKYKEFRDVTLAGEAKASGKQEVMQYNPGIVIKPESMLASMLEGDLRQRFFHFGYAYLDLTGAKIYVKASKKTLTGTKSKSDTKTITDQGMIDKYKNTPIPCFDIDQFGTGANLGGFMDLRYMKDHFGKSNPLILCDIHDSNRYLKGSNAELPKPLFYHYRSFNSFDDPTSSSVPFAHVNLWARRKLSIAQAEEFGIYNAKEKSLKLRGIVQINEPVTLGQNGGPIIVEGQGVLIAPGFTIKAGIKKKDENKDLCILLTRGYPITVDTDQLIEASLISMGSSNKNGFVKSLQKLNLKGALAVDLLRLNLWKEGVEHTIKYDPALKQNKDLYQVNISRWVSFERMIEKDE